MRHERLEALLGFELSADEIDQVKLDLKKNGPAAKAKVQDINIWDRGHCAGGASSSTAPAFPAKGDVDLPLLKAKGQKFLKDSVLKGLPAAERKQCGSLL